MVPFSPLFSVCMQDSVTNNNLCFYWTGSRWGRTQVFHQARVLFFIFIPLHFSPLSLSFPSYSFLCNCTPYHLSFPLPLCVTHSPTDIKAWPLSLQRSSDTRSLAGQLSWLTDLCQYTFFTVSQSDMSISLRRVVTWARGVTRQMIDDAFSTCLEWSCPHHTVITHSQAAAAQYNSFLFVDLVC